MSVLERLRFPRNVFIEEVEVKKRRWACQHVGPTGFVAEQTAECVLGSQFDPKTHYKSLSVLEEDGVSEELTGEASERSGLLDKVLHPRAEPRQAPDRCAISKKSYDDFIGCLEKIQSLEPLSNAPEFDQNRRDRVAHRYRNVGQGFKRHLYHRQRGHSLMKDKEGLQDNWRGLRRGTVAMLTRPPSPATDWVQRLLMLVNIGAFVYDFIVQIRACILIGRDTEGIFDWTGKPLTPKEHGVLFVPSHEEVHWLQIILFTIFLFKECFFVTFYVVWVLVFVMIMTFALLGYILAVLASLLVLLPVKVLSARDTLGGADKLIEVSLYDPFIIEVQYIAVEKADMLADLFLNLSILYRLKVAGRVFFSREVNSSFKDFYVKMTDTASIVFDLLVMAVEGRISVLLTLSMFWSFFMVLWDMAEEKTILDNMEDAFKDLNENRLTKFEIALLLVKMSEDATTEAIEYNFVEHFHTPEPFAVTVDEAAPDEPEELLDIPDDDHVDDPNF